MQCPSCNHEAPKIEFGDPLRCPDCGAYYEKAIALKKRKSEAVSIPAPLTVGALAQKADSALRFAADKVTPAANKRKMAKFYCPACGSVNDGRRHVPGSILIELVLWICLLIPGLIYSIWRHAASTKACSVCKTVGLIPVNSPRARRELAQ
jgi:ssDNA-binding Zn-finger/Zn-ribbon topoisomerase 1